MGESEITILSKVTVFITCKQVTIRTCRRTFMSAPPYAKNNIGTLIAARCCKQCKQTGCTDELN